jgi:selenocysteine-specific elongation factor
MRNIIVGTAGHIDHGKSALVEALTGTHPDRLEEEKRRGITLDLGFAFLDLGDVSVGFIDVPGHERFVRNMLAGAGGFDLVLLVIAADESIKPQTREHFEICKLLGIGRGLLALTKSDLVDSGTLDLVRLEAGEFVRGSFLENAPMIAVSAKTGEGMDQLRTDLARIARETPLKDPTGYFRLPIDRAFAMKGFGTVITGTLLSGEVAPEDELELFPSKRRVRVRGVQSGGKLLERATAGQRTALNLAGIDHHEIERGMVLAAPKRFEPTTRLDARVRLLPSVRKLKHRARTHFHQGTAEAIAEIYLLDGSEIAPGGSAFAQLRLSHPVLVLPGDRFILRQFSPVITIGGGVVLDAFAPRHRSGDSDATRLLQTLESGISGDTSARADALNAIIAAHSAGITLAELLMRTGWQEDEIQRLVESLARVGRLRIASQQPYIVASLETMELCAARMMTEVERFHRGNPLEEAFSKEELRMRAASAVRPEVFRAVLEDLVSAGKLSATGDLVKRAGRTIDLLPEELRAKEQIEREFARAGLTAPAVSQVLAALPVEARRAQKLLQLLLRERALVKVNKELVFHRDALDELRRKLAEYKRTQGERLAVGTFKELAGVSRKYAIPLLEYLDKERVTRRVDDYRVIL